ncbi:hypothetical protein Tco_0297893, partial [Tanacetum coccineum]
MVVNGGSQRWPTTVNSGGPPSTTTAPSPDHRSTAIDRQPTVGSNGGHRCHVAAKWYHVATHGTTWLLTWRGGDITLLLSFELTTKG